MKRPELLITNGAFADRRFVVGEAGLRLGRSSSNDIHIPDEELSRNHCLFEPSGEDGIRVTDLASANGTYLNGKPLGGEPVELHVGDLIEVGTTVLRVVGEELNAVPGVVDLGLGDAADRPPARRRRSPFANVLWGFAILFAAAAIYVVLKMPSAAPEAPSAAPAEEEPERREAGYEKVDADSEGIFRYEMSLSPEGVLAVTVDDVPKENRHLTRSEPLSERALAELREILSWKAVRDLDREYAGVEPDPHALRSWSLKLVYSSRARSIRVVNTQEPEAFRVLRERLEAFSKNQLGIWALQYSREKLIALAEDAITLARSKWDDRDVQHGNLHGAVTAYREALFYLETVNPKPDAHHVAQRGYDEACNELDKRYRDQRFLADRAINLGQWEVAQRELTTLLEMIPDRNDERNREATAKLVDVEKRMKGGK